MLRVTSSIKEIELTPARKVGSVPDGSTSRKNFQKVVDNPVSMCYT
jgi:hypothetical protein